MGIHLTRCERLFITQLKVAPVKPDSSGGTSRYTFERHTLIYLFSLLPLLTSFTPNGRRPRLQRLLGAGCFAAAPFVPKQLHSTFPPEFASCMETTFIRQIVASGKLVRLFGGRVFHPGPIPGTNEIKAKPFIVTAETK